MIVRDEYTCPLELTHDITRGKWNYPQVVLFIEEINWEWRFYEENMSGSIVMKKIKLISEKLLTFVESFGMIYLAAENGGKLLPKHIDER